MKFLYWLGCIFVAALLTTTLGLAGIGGALPTILIDGLAFYIAARLCKDYDKNKKNINTPPPIEAWVCPYCSTQNDGAFLICKKCGKDRVIIANPLKKQAEESIDNSIEDYFDSSEIQTRIPDTVYMQPIEDRNDIDDTDAKIRFCRKCGKELHEGSVFCSYCGVKVEESIL